jgi:hypothetical protein
MSIVEIIQAQLLMGMIGPKNAFIYQKNLIQYRDEINDFGPRIESHEDLQKEADYHNMENYLNMTSHR